MTVVSISNIKGGVAKTTTAATLAAGLHKRGYKVLMIDSDPQTNLTMCFMQEPDDGTPSLYTVYKDNASFDEVKYQIKEGLDLISGDIELCSADIDFLGKIGALKYLTKSLKEVKEDYDFVIVDTPPNLGFLSLNAFMASDYIVTPMSSESFSLRAIRLLKRVLNDISEEEEKEIPVAGVLLTRYEARTNLVKLLEEIVNDTVSILDTTVFKSKIRNSIAIQESQLVKKDIFEYAPKSPVANDYNQFIDEFLERIK